MKERLEREKKNTGGVSGTTQKVSHPNPTRTNGGKHTTRFDPRLRSDR